MILSLDWNVLCTLHPKCLSVPPQPWQATGGKLSEPNLFTTPSESCNENPEKHTLQLKIDFEGLPVNLFLGLVKSSQLQSNLPNILKPIVLRGFAWQIYLPKPSLLHLWAIWCLELTTKLIVFTQQNYLNIAVNLLPQWSLFWSDIICKCLIGLHNPWMRKCTVTPPLPLQPLRDNSAEGCDPLPHLLWRSFSTVWVCPGG